jgi:class 3 adenylate cyclase/tetratricopeptide (TPR) repeat protein
MRDATVTVHLARGTFSMKCQQCQHENSAKAKFCEECAAPLPRTCDNCGSQVSLTAKYCPQCGYPLSPVRDDPRFASPKNYTPQHLADKILTSRTALEGERKQVTVLFADIKGSMELLADRDPEDAQKLLDPVLERMIEAVHRYEGTVNRVMGDGIMALFGAPIAHEDHAVRACYAALRMQETVTQYADEVQRTHGVPVTIRVGLNSGEIVICAVGNDLHMDYTVVGQTAHLAARMEQMAKPGSVLTTADTLELAEGYVTVKPLGPVPVKGLANPVQIYEVTGAGAARTRLEVAAERGLTRFVGRDFELQQLRRVQQLAGQGHGQVVAIVGEAGVGKSRLVREFLNSQHTADWLVLESNSVSYGRATPYLPVIELLRHYFQISVHDSARSIREKVTGKILTLDAALHDAIPPVLDLLDALDDDNPFRSLDLVQRRQSTYQAVVRLLLSETRVQPVIAVFEDLHWHDALSLGLLNDVVVAAQDARLLLLVNFRLEYKDEWRNRPNYLQLHLDPLASGGLAELLQALLGSDESLSTLKSFLVERTSGNPFFIEEIVRRLADAAVLDGMRGSYRLARPFSSTEVPPTVQAVLAARIDALPAATKHLLGEAAVIGHDVPFALLHAICGLPEDELRGLLDHLQTAEFLHSTRLFPDLQYTFRHSLTHAVAYSGVLHERRREIHARVVIAMEKLHADRLGDQAERLADHAERGAIWDKALEYLQRSGFRACSLYANANAARFFERALTVLKKLPESPDNLRQAVDLRFGLRNALLPQGETDQIGRCLDELDPILACLGDKLRSARYAAFRCTHHFWIGQQRRAIEFGQTGARLARECDDRVLLGELLYRLAQSYYALGEYRQATKLLEQSLEFTPNELRQDRYDLSVIRSVVNRMWLVFAMVELGHFSAAMSHAKRALEIAEHAEHPLSEVLGWLSIGLVLLRKGELEGAVSALERGLDLCDSWSYRLTRPRLASALAVAYARTGRAEQGLQLALAAVSDAEQMHHTADKPGLLIRLGQVSLIGRQIETALTLGRQAVEIAVAQEAKGDEAWARFLIGRTCWASDPKDLDESEKQLDMARRLATACEARPLVAFCDSTLCGVHAQRCNQGRAQEFEAAATAIYRELGMQPLPLSPLG